MKRLLLVLVFVAGCSASTPVRYPGPPECARLIDGVIVMGDCP